MTSVNLHQILGVFAYVASLNVKTLKIDALQQYIDEDGIVLMLNLLVSGAIRPPHIKFNTVPSVDVLSEIKQFQKHGSKGIPMDTLQLLSYLNNPAKLGLRKYDIFKLLEDTDNLIDVYSILGGEDANACLICADALADGEVLCEHCVSALCAFEDFRSEDLFSTHLSYLNFPREVVLDADSAYKIDLVNYNVVIAGTLLTFTRVKSFQAQLPFKEYQKLKVD